MNDQGGDSARAVWGATPAGSAFGAGAAPGSREFFERVLFLRSTYEQPWLFELVPFPSTRGRSVLEIGCGAGYDAYEFRRHGARYTGVDIAPENVDRTRIHLGHFSLEADIREANALALPFENASFDVVYSNGVLHHTSSIQQSLREASRVLRPGGEAWVIVYHRNSIYYWLTLRLFEHVLKGGFRTRSFADRLAGIEQTTSGVRPIVNVYSRGELRRLLRQAGLHVESLVVRKVVLEDLPARRLFKWVPQKALDTIGKRFGWYLIAHATKPDDGAS